MNRLQKRLRTAYGNVCHLCQSDRNAADWIARAHKAAADGERRHRAHSPSSYKLPVEDAACFFAVKWFLGVDNPPKSFADAATLREDAFYALAARDRVKLDPGKSEHWHYMYSELQDIRELDYLKEFCR